MSAIVLPGEPSLKNTVARLAGTGTLYARWLAAEISARRGSALPTRQSSPRSLLLLASSFPPDVTGGVYRPLSFVQHAVECGWRVTVLTRPIEGVASAAGQHLERQMPEGVSVIRVPLPSLPLSWKLVPQVDGFFDHALEVFETATRRLVERPDLVLCTGPAFDMFIAGELIARRFRTQLVLDYRDEWNECPFHFVRKGRAGRSWERRCLARSAAVLFTTHSHLSHALARFPELKEARSFVVPNGWEPGDTEPSAASRSVDNATRKFSVLFLGILSFQSMPGSFLDVLASAVQRYPELAERLCLRFTGKKIPLALAELNAFPHRQMLQLSDHVPRSQLPALMAESGALLLLGDPRYERCLPGKMFDYLASERPILVFGCRGEAGALVERLDAGVVVPEADGECLAQALLTLMDGGAERWCSDARRQWALAHTRRRSAERALAVLDSVVGAAE